ncbi:MAG: penicillin-binding transpeptidase domain-containing protein [Thermodesulfobacteriota bacterium]
MDRRTRGYSRLRLKRKKGLIGPRTRRLVFRAVLLAAVLYAAVVYLAPLFLPDPPAAAPRPDVVVLEPQPPASSPQDELDKKELAKIIGPRAFEPDELYTFRIEDGQGQALFVRTTLDPGLQAWAVGVMPQVKAPAAALVVLDPASGQVLAMASHREDGGRDNVALSSSFPAASLFKIVTAAAAVENEQMSSGSTLAYDGRKHTLYKQDVAKEIDQGRHKVTLKEGFADSINTVFGKLGAFNLGPEALESFAERFHFNLPIDFEMPVEKSQFAAPAEEDPYRLAELASGLNRTTKVSPLHGAMLASAIVNQGLLMEPTVVREVFDKDNRIYYEHQPKSLGRVVSERTVSELQKLMRATVLEGTGRRGFGDADKHPVLARLEIGGKSGTIDDDQGRRVDWFVCYARPKGGGRAVALSAVVVHGPKLGVRSQVLIREAIINYFGPRQKKTS